MRYPIWITEPSLVELPLEVRDQKRITFLFKLAALYYSEEGTLKELASGLGLSVQTLYNAINSGECRPELAHNIEALIGRDVCPREELCSLFK